VEEDSGGCECIEEGGRSNLKQIDIKEIEREGSEVMRNAGLPFQSGDGSTERERDRERDNNRGCMFVRTTGSGGL